jgi:adenylate kinase family enzyme
VTNVHKVYLTIGLPCSGKSSLARTIAALTHGAKIISMGDIARGLTDRHGNFAAMATIDQYPDEAEIRAALLTNFAQQSGIVVIDGLPRYPDQVKFVRDTFDIYSPEVFYAQTADWATLCSRAKLRGRDDTDRDTLKFGKRLMTASKNMSAVHREIAQYGVVMHNILTDLDDVSIKKSLKKILGKNAK